MSFTQKQITSTITLAQGSFAGTTGQNSVTLSNYRMSAKIVKSGGNSQGELQLLVYGLGLPLMNQLSTLGKTPVIIDTRNTISVSAGDSSTGLSIVFVGNIYTGTINLAAAPGGVFQISAFAGLGQALKTVPPSSYQGGADAAVIMQSLAAQGGLDFENNGVSVMLHSSYFPGSLRVQMQACAEAANIYWIIDNGKLAIWPKNGYRAGTIPLISATSNPPMIGYPFPSGQGLLGLKSQFNPQLSFGGQVQVDSIITGANGVWTICHVDHDIECQLPGGKWETTITATPPGYLTVQS